MANFTITNVAAGDTALDIGTIAKGGTKGTDFITPNIRAAQAAGLVTISPTIGNSPVMSVLTAVAGGTPGTQVVDPSTQALTRSNDLFLMGAINVLIAEFNSLYAYVYANLKMNNDN